MRKFFLRITVREYATKTMCPIFEAAKNKLYIEVACASPLWWIL